MRAVLLAIFLAFLAAWPTGIAAQSSTDPDEVIVEVRVHGNSVTPDDEIRQMAGLSVGGPATPDVFEIASARLRATNQFDSVEVLKRYASITDATQVVAVILVDEGPVRIDVSLIPGRPARVVRRRGPGLMFLPVLDAEDGYGLSYGARFALPNVTGRNSRLSFPLTWGGDKRAGAELEKEFAAGPVHRLIAGAFVQRRTHPFFRSNADRGRLWARAERQLVGPLRVGGGAAWQSTSLVGQAVAQDVDVGSLDADLVLDTRLDPVLARNAVYARAAIERLDFDADPVTRTQLEARGYIGLLGQSVLVLRALREDANGPLPLYFKSILGGNANLRGFRAGSAVGDTLVAGSIELRLPLTSPLYVAKLGVSVFTDWGTTYDDPRRLRDQSLENGIGGGVWFSAAVFRLSLAVAHGRGSGTRMHVGGGVLF